MKKLTNIFFLHRLTLLLALLAIIYPTTSFAEKAPQSPKEASKQTARFIDNGDGTVTDTESNLMWAAKDNGKDIDFEDAEIYCSSFSTGKYNDWRMPDIEELESLYDGDAKNKKTFKIVEPIHLSSCCPWSSYDSFGSSSAFNFQKGKETWGFKADTQLLRALPVRDIKKTKTD